MLTYAQFIKEAESLNEKVVDLENSLNIARKDMPQIRSFNMEDYLSWLLKTHNVTHKTEIVSGDKLKPIQAHIETDRVATLKPSQSHERPMVVSRDGYILDGHHRWFQAKQNGEKIKIVRVSVPMKQLLKITKDYPKVEYASI